MKFRLELDVFCDCLPTHLRTLTFYYSNLKLLRQGYTRKDNQYVIIDHRKYILTANGDYEPFAVFGKSTIPLTELKAAVTRLELEEKEKFDINSPQQSRKIKKTWK